MRNRDCLCGRARACARACVCGAAEARYESIVLDLELPPLKYAPQLLLQLWDWDRTSKDDFVSDCRINLSAPGSVFDYTGMPPFPVRAAAGRRRAPPAGTRTQWCGEGSWALVGMGCGEWFSPPPPDRTCGCACVCVPTAQELTIRDPEWRNLGRVGEKADGVLGQLLLSHQARGAARLPTSSLLQCARAAVGDSVLCDCFASR